MLPQRSLRLRLLLLLLVPLSLISVAAMAWRYTEARATAQEIFDRNLLITAFAVARDVALSGGDSIAPETQSLLRGASGGDVFYHVYGPDGSFVTGYSSPPVASTPNAGARIQQYDARHQGQPVRVARLLEQTEIDGIAGTAVVTVWQRLDQRGAFVRRTALQAGVTVLLLLVSVAALVLWGVGLGLRPLEELEDAIQKRSSAELGPITRAVPKETEGIVKRLNQLFAQVTEAQEAHQRFVSLAAHQLRNPIAAIHTLAEATHTARSYDDAHERAEALIRETRFAVRLTDQLLSFERIKGAEPNLTAVDLAALLQEIAQSFAGKAIDRGVAFDLERPEGPVTLRADAFMLGEAVSNLLENALAHGGPDLTRISLSGARDPGGSRVVIRVTNDGAPLSREDADRMFERFVQGEASKGAGLGLSIAISVAERHGGMLSLHSGDPVCFELCLPVEDPVLERISIP